MKPDKKYVVIKSIPLNDGGSIPVNSIIYRTHGVYYLEGGLLSRAYQEDFNNLIEHEEMHGWKYLSPIREKELYHNSKEGL